MQYVLGIDLGTSYFKFGLFDREGRLAGFSRVAAPKRCSGEEHELPVDAFWATLCDGVGQAAEQAGASEADVVAVSYSSQANSFVLTDSDLQPLTPLILWPDRRSPRIPPRIEALWARDDFLSTTGVGIAPSAEMAVVKLAALAEQPVWQQVHRVLSISDYLTLSLTGQPVGDAGTAVLLGLLNVAELDWWAPALQAAQLDEQVLSRPLRPGSFVGHLTPDGGQRIGLTPNADFCVGTLDHHSAALGAGFGTLANVSLSMGTVLACLQTGRDFQPAHDRITGPSFEPGEFFQMAFRNEGAAMLEAYRNDYAPGLTVADLLTQAASAPGDCGGVNAILDAAAGRVRFEGGTARAATGTQARAVLEAVAENASALLKSFCQAGDLSCLMVTGGAARSAFWTQLLANRVGCEVQTTRCQEPACLGAALLAARGAGWFNSLSEATGSWITSARCFHPE